MKTLRILMLALLLPAFMMTGCATSGDNPGDAQIVLPNDNEKTQQAFADDETTGGFTFTAKSAWTAIVTETGGSTRADGTKWLRLLFDGRETYSGAAGKFTLVIELDENYSGETRTATITIKSGADTISITVTQDGKKEDGTVPVEPGKPVPDGMRYVSRIDVDYGDGDVASSTFDYDSKNRVIKVTGIGRYGGAVGWETEDASFTYDDAARTVTMTVDEKETHRLKLTASGALVSGESLYDNSMASYTAMATYTNGYLDKFTFIDNSEDDYYETFTMTWSGGNMTRMVYEDPDFDPVTDNLSYNSSSANNPLCNLDLNAVIYGFDDGIYSGYAELLGLFGNRSRHMVSSYTTTGGNNAGTYTSTVEYDTTGFVSKITKVDDEGYTEVYTITYR